MARRSGVRGGARLRRFLAAMPKAVEDEVMTVLDEGSADLVQQMKARAPHKTGATQAALGRKLFPRSLRVRVGLVGPRVPFWARIQELGRRGRTVEVRRRAPHSGFSSKTAMRRAGTKGAYLGRLVIYKLQVKPMAAKRFVTGRYPEARRAIGSRLRNIWTNALRRLAGSGQ